MGKSDNSHRNHCSHTSVIPWVLTCGDLAVIGCFVTLRLLRGCRDLSIISLYASRLRDLRNGPRAGRPGAGVHPLHFAVGLRGGTWPTLAQALGTGSCSLCPCPNHSNYLGWLRLGRLGSGALPLLLLWCLGDLALLLAQALVWLSVSLAKPQRVISGGLVLKISGSALKIYPAPPETPWCVQGILYVLNSNFQAFLVTPGTPWSPGVTSDVFRSMWFPCSSGLGLRCLALLNHPRNHLRVDSRSR